jgi:hypothetical protein
MNKILRFLTYTILLIIFTFSAVFALKHDWRNVKNGHPIFTNGYCDQPYVVVLGNGKWLCVFTTNEGHEGTGGQHIVSSVSDDQGKTWSDTVRIENPGNESASWAMPYLTKYGRVYVFYSYNGDKIHELNGRKIREDMLGWYCYKYSDDEGKTWSQRHRLDVRLTEVDRSNDWKGEVQIMWGIGKPVHVDDGMMFAFTKIGQYMLDNSEGWFFRCDNIHKERDVSKLNWILLPEGEEGLKNSDLGPINAEQNIFQMNDGTIYCMHRTISGHPAESYSYDGGKSWTKPKVPAYLNGVDLKNPRACPRIWKCKNGKYLFWYHHHGGWNFNSRNPAWISGGIERDGKIIWSQPEILLYEEKFPSDPALPGDFGKEIRMSYPDLIEQNGKYWITETNKENARCHPIPAEFFEKLWSQFELNEVTKENLVAEWNENQLVPRSTLQISEGKGPGFGSGFTLDFRIALGDLAKGQTILSATGTRGENVILQTGDYGSVEIIMNDGKNTVHWKSDPGIIKAYGEHSIAVSVDNGPSIIQFVVNGNVCNGRDFRQYGWTHFNCDINEFDFNRIEVGELGRGQIRPLGRLTNLRLYSRALMNTEVISNHKNFME